MSETLGFTATDVTYVDCYHPVEIFQLSRNVSQARDYDQPGCKNLRCGRGMVCRFQCPHWLRCLTQMSACLGLDAQGSQHTFHQYCLQERSHIWRRQILGNLVSLYHHCRHRQRPRPNQKPLKIGHYIPKVVTLSRFLNELFTVWVWFCEKIDYGHLSTCIDNAFDNSTTDATGSAWALR